MRIPERVRAIELPQFDLLNEMGARWRARGADVINLGQGLPGFAPPPIALEAMERAIRDGSSHIYTTDAGLPELRQALAASLKPLGADIDPDSEIIITAGGNQAFQLALTTLVDPGDDVVLASPYFLNHEMSVRSVGANPIEAAMDPADGFAVTWDRIAPHVTPRTTAVVLVTPSNPTGGIVAPRDMGEIIDKCAARDIVVFVDETYLRFVYDGAPATAAAFANWRDHVVIVGSFSKAFAVTGWRCGYLIANPDVIEQALKIQDCMVICAPTPVQRAIAAVLEAEPHYTERWIGELNARRDHLQRGLAAIEGLRPIPAAGSFFMMVGVDGGADSRALAMRLIEEQQVVTIPGRYFGEAGEGYLRLAFGASDKARLDESCRRLGAFMAGRSR